MNKKNRKGFTIVELVIVIAVIGILATVLVPTFGNVIDNANESAAVQEAKNTYTNYASSINYAEKDLVEDLWVKTTKGYYVQFVDGGVKAGEEFGKTAPTGAYWELEKGDTEPECVNCTKATTECTNCKEKPAAGN